MTAVLLDRFTLRCDIFEMNGPSYRFKESVKMRPSKDNGHSKFYNPLSRASGESTGKARIQIATILGPPSSSSSQK